MRAEPNADVDAFADQVDIARRDVDEQMCRGIPAQILPTAGGDWFQRNPLPGLILMCPLSWERPRRTSS